MADKNFTPSWHIPVGLNHTPAYQVSGVPFASGSINCNQGSPVCIKFPSVTRWILIVNNDTQGGPSFSNDHDVKVGFSEDGVMKNNFFVVPFQGGAPGLYPNSGRLELKVSEIWMTGSSNVDVVAGLTSITPEKVATAKGPSWSGSSGVG